MPKAIPYILKICSVEGCGREFRTKEHGRRSREACGRACADRLRAERSRSTQCKKIERVCEGCGGVRIVSPAYADRRFCSRACWYAKNSGEGSTRWKGGYDWPESNRFYFSKEWIEMRDRIKERDDSSCRKCNRRHNDFPGKRRWVVHHIRRWQAWPEYRLDPENLVYLCSRCHGFVHSGRNTGGEFILPDP